jgi:ABC-2 type transport system permease protein
MKTLWIAATNLGRTFRMRTNIFFILIFPMLLILVLGATIGGSSSPRLGVVWAARHRPGAPA